MSDENNVVQVKLRQRTKELLEALVLNGKYAENIEDAVDYIINERFVFTEDIKTSIMVGLLKLGHADEVILHMIKGSQKQNQRCLARAKIIVKKSNDFIQAKQRVGLQLPERSE